MLFYPPDFVGKIARTLVSSCRILCSMGLSCLVRLLDRFLVNVLTVDTNVSHYYNSFLTNISIVLSNIGNLVLASGFNVCVGVASQPLVTASCVSLTRRMLHICQQVFSKMNANYMFELQ